MCRNSFGSKETNVCRSVRPNKKMYENWKPRCRPAPLWSGKKTKPKSFEKSELNFENLTWYSLGSSKMNQLHCVVHTCVIAILVITGIKEFLKNFFFAWVLCFFPLSIWCSWLHSGSCVLRKPVTKLVVSCWLSHKFSYYFFSDQHKTGCVQTCKKTIFYTNKICAKII